MADTPEFSESGAPILRHEHREREFEPAFGDSETLEKITEHIRAHIGEPANVFHELVSDLVHIDVHMVNPTTDRNYYTLVTSGMSDRPMTAPEGEEQYRFAELLICLPPTWPLTQEAFKNEANYWPIRWLKILARLPHEYKTWLSLGHTVPNGDPPEPFAPNTKLCGALIAPPIRFGSEVCRLVAGPEKTINFFGVVPLYREEMDFKLKRGSEELTDRFDNAGISELLDIRRTNVCKKRLGFF